MLQVIKALYQAFQAGKIIANPEMWKSGGELTAAVTAFVASLFAVAVYFFPNFADLFTTETASLFGAIIISALGLVSIVIGRVTTKKEIGIGVLIEGAKSEAKAEDM